MGKKLYVGNLSADTTAADLEALFSQVGPCLSATVVTDRVTGQSRGFGFVEMSSDNDAQKAVIRRVKFPPQSSSKIPPSP